MAAELKGEWSTTSVTKSGVTGTTASYKINGKEVIKLTNLSSSLEAVDGKIDGLTVDEDNKTVTLSGSALNEQTVAFTSSTYTLELDDVPAVEFTDVEPTVASGKITFKSPMSEGYTLSANGKTLTYSAAKTEPQEVATVSGLATNADDSNVVYDDGVITLSPDALKAANVSLKLNNGAAFTLAIDDDVQKIEAGGTWTVTKGTATLKGTVTQDGYAVAPDGKSVNYLKVNAKEATLAIVKGLNTTYTDDMDVTTAVDENGNYIITLPQAALNAKDVTVSGTGYALALQDGSVPTSETVEKTDEWTVSGTTATYNQVMPEHYDVSGAKVVYTKAATVQTYAKVAGLKSGLTADGEAITDGTNDVITVSGKVITLAEGALNNAGVTLTSDDYSLALDNVQEPVIDDTTGGWSLSGKNGGIYKAKVTTPGWGLKDSKTVTYTAASNSAVVGTITGLKSGVTVATLTEGIDVKTTEGTFTIDEDLLTNTDVVLVNGNGFGYSLATDVNTPENVHSWDVADTTDGATATAKLYYGKSAYYVASDDGTTLAYNKPESGSSVATIQFLKAGTTAEEMPANDEITKAAKAKNYTIPLSKDVLTTKTVTLTGTGYALAIDPNENLSAKSGKTIWELTDVKGSTPTATLSNYTTEGWAANSGGTQIVYSAPVTGATIATLEGFKSGLKLNDKKTEFTSGIVVGDGDNGYEAGKIAIEKAAVGSSKITLTSSAYKLVVGKDLTESEAERKWTTDSKGAAVYTYTTPAGYSISDNGKTFTATKKATVTATITGLGTNPTTLSQLTPDEENKTITLSKSFLGTSDVTIKGAYKLAIDSSVKAPVVGNNTWDMSKKGTAVLKGQVTTAGYTLTSDTTIAYTAPTDTSNQILATISGLNTTAGQTDTTGLEVGDGVITLSSNVLNKSKVTIKSDSYKLALDKTDEDLPLKKEDVTEWVVSSTTANYQTYTKGYYAMETKKDGTTETGAIIYNKDGKATTLATVKGLAKGTTIDTDEDYDDNTKTLTLNADQLGTTNVTLTGSGYSLALGSDVQKTKEEVTEWVNSGTKATYQTYDKAYYTQSGNTITYNKPGKATVHLTLNGVADEVTASNLNTSKKTITLNADQLNHKSNKAATKLTTSKEEAYQGYKIVLASGTSAPDSDEATWAVDGKGKATYNQPIAAGNYVNDGTTVTYYNADTKITLATISGLNKTSVTTSSFSGVKVKDGVITLTSSVLQTNKDDASTKVTVSKGYELALDSSVAEPEPTDPEWSFADLEKKGTATYNNAVSAGYSIDSKGAVNYSAAKTTNTLATLSGLNKTSGYDNATDAGISVNEETGVITLSNADALTNKVSVRGTGYTVAVSSDLTPQTITDYTKGIWSLKGTTATLSLGTSAGYVQDKNKTSVSLGKATVGDTVATLSGLGKNTKVDNGQLGTLANKVFTQGVFIRSTGAIALTPAVLGTTDVVLTNAGDNALTISNENFTEPDIGERIWKYDASKGTATLYQTTTEGWTLNEAKTTLEYTANQDNAVLTTISGLSKTFEGDIDATVINTPENKNDTLTIEDPDLLGTSKVTIKNATGYTYALALGGNVPGAAETVTNWLTAGAKATLKTYKTAYYTLDKGAIVYKKSEDVKNSVQAEVSGIAKDVDINDCVNENTHAITLGAGQLDAKTVTLTNKKLDGVTSDYTLVLGSDATKATPDTTATWVTGTGTTANLTASVSAGFTQTSDTKLTYTRDQPKAVLAVIKGVNKGAMDGDSFTTSSTTISPATANLSKAVTIDGKETYGFKFASDYTGKITGASTADTITAAGAGVSIAAGAGDDSISISGGNASINAGKGDDSIKSGGGNNTFYYATGDGDDTIASFAQATDKIMTNTKANVIAIEKDGSNAVITIGAGTKNEGTITLTGKGSAIASIIIVDTKGNAIEPSYTASSDVLLADDNYSTDAAALTDITDAFSASYTPYDFDAGLDLVKKDSFTPVVSYMGDDK